jgi:nucleoside phosphorylase
MRSSHVSQLVEQAFAYRGYVTVHLRDGSSLVGFVYERGPSFVELFDERAVERLRVPIDDIANITFTGEDSAATAQHHWERRRGVLESHQTSAWGDWREHTNLIAVALPSELRAVASALGTSARGGVVRSTIGDTRWIARAIGVGGGAEHVIAGERPRLVISCGFAGGLDPSLRPGDLVLATSVCDETGDSVTVRQDVLGTARRALAMHGRIAEGEVLCATRVLARADDKRSIARPGRYAVDLESWGAARAADRARVPWLVLRVIVDPHDVDLPPFVTSPRAHYLGAAVRHALGGPRGMRELVHLGLFTRAALQSLRRAVEALVPELGQLGRAEERA